MAQYIAKVKPTARRSDFSEIKALAGAEVEIYPETRKWIEAIKDYQYKVVPLNYCGKQLEQDIRLCARHLRPMNENAAYILNVERPAQ